MYMGVMFFWCVNTVAFERLFYFQKSKLFL
nr:MAG TPA: hypothetical protein [Caudoviricetes sp.]DAQ90321.1 MAG TPA: hypothetical protein [Caudoviricetes sp.]